MKNRAAAAARIGARTALRERSVVAGETPPDYLALHADVGVVAEHGGGLLLDHHPAGHPPRQLHLGPRPHRRIETFIDGWNDRCHPFTGPRPPTRYFRNAAQVNEPRSHDTSNWRLPYYAAISAGPIACMSGCHADGDCHRPCKSPRAHACSP
jgi:hypothetical protein